MDAIKAINKFAGIQDASCRPLLGLLDQLGAPRLVSLESTHVTVPAPRSKQLDVLFTFQRQATGKGFYFAKHLQSLFKFTGL